VRRAGAIVGGCPDQATGSCARRTSSGSKRQAGRRAKTAHVFLPASGTSICSRGSKRSHSLMRGRHALKAPCKQARAACSLGQAGRATCSLGSVQAYKGSMLSKSGWEGSMLSRPCAGTQGQHLAPLQTVTIQGAAACRYGGM